MPKGLFNRLGLYVVSALLGLATANIQAQSCNLTLSGRIVDLLTQEPIAYANVYIKEQGLGTVSDEEGYYKIEGICAGNFTISCTHVSCNHLESSMLIESDTHRDFFLEHGPVAIQNITVTSKALPLTRTQAVSELKNKELASARGLGLGTALTRLPGVTALSTGSSISKPVIQGLHSNRIVMLNNGVRQEGQQWGAEHAPEIDPFIADKLTIIKGANSVRYGAEALGGVVLVQPKALPTQYGLGGELNLVGYSNGWMGVASGMVEGRLRDEFPLSARLQGTVKRGGNVKAPDYFLGNTGIGEYNFSGAMAYDTESFKTEVFYSQFNTTLGIFSGSHIGNLTDLVNAYQSDAPLLEAGFDYELGRPQQKIEHELFKTRADIRTGDRGKLQVVFSRQFNRRQEFDAHRPFDQLDEKLTEPQQKFEITTHTGDVVWEHQSYGNFSGSMGGQLMRQRNTTDRGGLIPNFTSWSGGLFLIERWRNYPFPFEWEAGLRGDYKWLSVEANQNTVAQSFEFRNLSGTAGALYRFSDELRIKYNFSSAWRAPNVNELFSDGVHHGAAAYEKGRADLHTEVAFNNSLSLKLEKERFWFEFNVYYNRINNFIYLQPRPEGKLTIRGAFPAFDYRQADAGLAGIEGMMSWTFVKKITWQGQFALLRARNLDAGDYLSLMPADHFENSLNYQFGQPDKENYLKLKMLNTLRQTRIAPGGDLLPPPEGYTRFDLELGTRVELSGQPVEIGLSIDNIFNLSYREYLNRFRYFTDELGRNVMLRVRIPMGQTAQ